VNPVPQLGTVAVIVTHFQALSGKADDERKQKQPNKAILK
jgi:hypothetical protein